MAITASALLVKVTEEYVVEASLIIFVPHAEEDCLNSHHTQHFLVSCLISYEILLLTPLLL